MQNAVYTGLVHKQTHFNCVYHFLWCYITTVWLQRAVQLCPRIDSQRCASEEEDEEVKDYRVKCLNNLAAAQLKLGQVDEALHTSRDVLFLDPQNVKALFRKGKVWVNIIQRTRH